MKCKKDLKLTNKRNSLFDITGNIKRRVPYLCHPLHCNVCV